MGKDGKHVTDDIGKVDLAFVVDSTGSMSPFIDEARREIKRILDEVATDAGLDLRVALVAYRDHPPQDSSFVTHVTDWKDTQGFKMALGRMFASGGGDAPEAVFDGLDAAVSLKWRRKADRRLWLVGDAPPHGMAGQWGDGFPQGCPCGLTLGGVARSINEGSLRLSVISIGSDVAGFKDLATACEGEYTTMSVDDIHQASHSVHMTMASTAGLVNSARSYVAASASIGSTDASLVAAAAGISVDEAERTAKYLESRGLMPDID